MGRGLESGVRKVSCVCCDVMSVHDMCPHHKQKALVGGLRGDVTVAAGADGALRRPLRLHMEDIPENNQSELGFCNLEGANFCHRFKRESFHK